MSKNHPKYLQTPYELVEDERITSTDERIYGVVHWYAKMKNKRCSASNETIAKIAKTTVGTVQNSLSRMEKCGYLRRTFRDESRRVRESIIPLVGVEDVSPTDDTQSTQVSLSSDTVSPGSDTQVSPGSEENKNRSIKNRYEERREGNQRRSRVVKFTVEDLGLATLLYEKILENNPTFKRPNLETWATHIRLAREQDNRTEEQLRVLILWSQQNSFWKANILSTQKLREKFDTLVAQFQRDREENQAKLTKHKVAFT